MNEYQQVKTIGEGSYGRAILVRGKTNHKQYVIKEIKIAKVWLKNQEIVLVYCLCCVLFENSTSRNHDMMPHLSTKPALTQLQMNRRERAEAQKEVTVLRQMKHPNIVSYVDSFEERGNLYIVMDFCEGGEAAVQLPSSRSLLPGDLHDMIQKRRGRLLSENEVLDLFVQICLAIKHVRYHTVCLCIAGDLNHRCTTARSYTATSSHRTSS